MFNYQHFYRQTWASIEQIVIAKMAESKGPEADALNNGNSAVIVQEI